MSYFSHIPEFEKKKQWFLLWKPIIDRRLRCANAQGSELLQILSFDSGLKTWMVLKRITEYALEHCQDTLTMFTRISSKMRFESNDQDEIIMDLLAEVRAPIVLKLLGFDSLTYFRENALDFKAILNGVHYKIEVAHIRGESFKTQQIIAGNIYKLSDLKLIELLDTIYQRKACQVIKHRAREDGIIFIDAENLNETNSFWLNHTKDGQRHPIQDFVDSCPIPTIVWASGLRLYIPQALQDKINIFDKGKYIKLLYDCNPEAVEMHANRIRKKLAINLSNYLGFEIKVR